VSLHAWINPQNWSGDTASFAGYADLNHTFVLRAANNAIQGAYTATITVKGSNGTAKATYAFNVEGIPAALQKQPLTAAPALPSLASYNATMTTEGKHWCDPALINTWDGSVYYYDGARVYFQIGDYTHDTATWNRCAQLVLNVYRPFVSAGPAEYKVFPHGLARDYRQNHVAASKASLDTLTSRSSAGAYVKWLTDWSASREVAYGLDALLEENAFGQATLSNAFGRFSVPGQIDILTRVALGHLDQWFMSKTAGYVRPFMVALTAEALIAAYERHPDPRIPARLKLAADAMWATMWLPNAMTNGISTPCFMYTDRPSADQTGGQEGAPDLNLLIAPLYGWLYQQTGDLKYRIRGDSIFAGGVAAFPPYQGKQFSQNYRWSEQYLVWRQP
jgi:hypothetical protein